MVALLVSYFLVAYLLIPRAIFQLVDIWLPLKFQRTRTEEVTFAAWICLVPLIFGLLLIWALSEPHFGVSRTDYKLIFAGSYSEGAFESSQIQFWSSLWKVAVSQFEFLLIYVYPLVIAEAILFVILVRRYGNWRGKSKIYDWLVERVLLRGVSEWHVLLTTFNFASSEARRVTADILTIEDHLYQGDVANYYIESDGSLSGFSLEDPFRFDRAGYLRDKQTNPEAKAKSYWKEIPGKNLYIPRDKVLSLNLRYPTSSLDEEAKAATAELLRSDPPIRVEVPSEISLAKKPTVNVRVEVKPPAERKT